MADRFVNPVTDLKALGSLYFFKAGTNSPLTTYADDLENITNPAQIDVDANGNLPNVFLNGSARVKYLDQFGVQYEERDPVGGERQLGDFTLWDTQVIYDLNDIVERNNKFYQSLSNANQANDPDVDATKWKEIRFIGVYNINVTYVIGDITQTSTGSLWRSLTATNLNNNPETDDGTNWIPAIDGAKVPEIASLESLNVWIMKSSDFPAIARESYQIDGSGNAVDITMPALVIGDVFTFHNETTSTNKVQILNPLYTINGPNGVIPAATDIEMAAGDSVQLVAKSSTILEIVGAQA